MPPRSGPRRRSPRLLALDDGPDLISTLPDDLLLLVLARLGCAAAAARTGVLSRRWRGLWPRLRRIVFNDVALPLLEAALGGFPPPPPTVSLLQIRLSKPRLRVPKEQRPDTARFTSLLRAAARLDPEELVLVLPSRFVSVSVDLVLPCFHRATSIVLADVWFHKSVLSVNSRSLQELVVAGATRIQHLNIVTPVLTQLTMSLNLYHDAVISVLAPMVEKVSWHCFSSAYFRLWRLESIDGRGARTALFAAHACHCRASLHMLLLNLLQAFGKLNSVHEKYCCKLFFQCSSIIFHGGADSFAKKIEKHMIIAFSVLEPHITTKGHVYGAFVAHLLGMNRIRCDMQRLKVSLKRSKIAEECPPHCPCGSPNWKSQTISLTSLEEVEINGFEGEDHEFDLLKLILRSAPMLKGIIMKLSQEASASSDKCTKIYSIFREFSTVECYVYLSSGLMHGSQNCMSI